MNASRELTLGYSPCPNDTFIFCALAEGRIDTGPIRIRTLIEDVEALNLRAAREEVDVTKLSFHAFAHLRDRYVLLRSGAALGRGCGPLVVARRILGPAELRDPALRVAVPGLLTTASLLWRLFAPDARDLRPMPFEKIFDAVLSGEADAGVIIHEGRFTYRRRGLERAVDLGEWWEARTGLPLPLGGIAAARRLGDERIRDVERWVRESVQNARADPARTAAYVRAHAQEMDEAVMRAHIDLYVNDFTVDLGEEGNRAVGALLRLAEEHGVSPAPTRKSAAKSPGPVGQNPRGQSPG